MLKIILGVLCGFANGLFGAGGGLVAVPALESTGLEPKKSHATSVAVIFSLSILTSILYAINDRLVFDDAFSYIPWGILGAVLGSAILKKINNSLLRRIFGGIMIVASIRLLFFS